jgi:all-trans-retinol 13,14-reductase
VSDGRCGTPLKRYAGPERWDAIVIGSGIGGLGAAWLLGAKLGKRVLVAERHYTAGGFTHTFRRPGYEWDVGVHYIGQATDAGGLGAMFTEVFGDGVEWAAVGDVYDTVVLGPRRYEYLAGRERWRARMLEYFPGEARAVDAYLARVRRAVGASGMFWAEKAVPAPLAFVGGWAMRAPFLRHARDTTREVLESMTANQELIAVLTAQWGDYGLPPAQSSFAMHAILANHYLEGAFFPVGGAATMARAAAAGIERHDGAVVVGAEVSAILVEGGRAAGVRMADGREFRAPVVISDAGLSTTLRLIPRATPGRDRLSAVATRLRPSAAHMCLYVGLRDTDAALGLPRCNLWVYPGPDYEHAVDRFAKDPEAGIPLAFISFPSAKDPSFGRRFPGRATIEVVTLGNYEWFDRWADERWRRRGDDYEGFKARFCDRLLEILYREVPQARGAVAVAELSTPLSTRHFANYGRGEMYGLAHDPARFLERALRPRTPVPGLWLTGQDVCTCGVGGALGGAYLTASAIARRSLLPRR